VTVIRPESRSAVFWKPTSGHHQGSPHEPAVRPIPHTNTGRLARSICLRPAKTHMQVRPAIPPTLGYGRTPRTGPAQSLLRFLRGPSVRLRPSAMVQACQTSLSENTSPPRLFTSCLMVYRSPTSHLFADRLTVHISRARRRRAQVQPESGVAER
jgi:hypothetical protein